MSHGCLYAAVVILTQGGVQRSEETIFTRFAVQVRKGKFQNRKVLLDLVKAMVEVEDRQASGTGLQNFHYGTALSEFAHICAITSPELYRRLAEEMPLPALRTLAYVLHCLMLHTLADCIWSCFHDSDAIVQRCRGFPLRLGSVPLPWLASTSTS